MNGSTRRSKSAFPWSLNGQSPTNQSGLRKARKRRERRKLFMESLEDRQLLATFSGTPGSPLLLDLNTQGENLISRAEANYCSRSRVLSHFRRKSGVGESGGERLSRWVCQSS
jgi:hypothetical protein